MRLKKKIWISGIIILLIAIIVYFFYSIAIYTSDAYIKSNYVVISSSLDGNISKVLVARNQFVKKGTLLCTIYKLPFKLKVEACQAELAEAKSEYLVLATNIATAKSTIEEAKKELSLSQKKEKRFALMYKENLVPLQKYQDIESSYIVMKQGVVELLGKYNELLKNLQKQENTVNVAKSKLDQAKYQLSLTNIRAPFSGYVTDINLMPGKYVKAEDTLFSIVQSQLCWVVANFKESHIGSIKPGQSVIFTTELYPFKIFHGKVESIIHGISRQSGVQNQGVPYIKPNLEWIRLERRFSVKIKIDKLPADINLRMGADARVLIWLK